jgi:hypothetical protein
MDDASPLTSRYKSLQQADASDYSDVERSNFRGLELDRLYQQIVTTPITSLTDAIDKLAFADHCLNEEDDFKEASNLIREVAQALLILRRATATPDTRFAANDTGAKGDIGDIGHSGKEGSE